MMSYQDKVVLIADGVDDSQGERFTSLNGVTFATSGNMNGIKVTLGFDPRRPIGWAVGWRHDGNRLLVSLDLDTTDTNYAVLVPCVGGKVLKKLEARRFAVIDQIEINEIGLCHSNADPRIPALGEPSE
jgi:hypothetical protein